MEDYFSYDDSSDSDFDSISINVTNKDYETSSFQERVKNKQVEAITSVPRLSTVIFKINNLKKKIFNFLKKGKFLFDFDKSNFCFKYYTAAIL
jgi:hypothetical protein